MPVAAAVTPGTARSTRSRASSTRSRGEFNSQQGRAAGPAAEQELTPAALTPRPSQRRPVSGGSAAAKVLRQFGERLCPELLVWNDWLPAVAISRSAMCAKHLQLARLSQQTERRLLRRGFGSVLSRLHMPAVLDVISCALGRWRALLVHPALVVMHDRIEEDMFLDALLSLGLALSRGVPARMVKALRVDLRARHDGEFDAFVAIIASQV